MYLFIQIRQIKEVWGFQTTLFVDIEVRKIEGFYKNKAILPKYIS